MWSTEQALGVCRAPWCGARGDLAEVMGCFSDPQCSSLLHPMGLVMPWAGLRAGDAAGEPGWVLTWGRSGFCCASPVPELLVSLSACWEAEGRMHRAAHGDM